eukprot:TRINITY_DN960_c0_g1_i2.p1 TRINITY_DN960_c0_g1~~TRINITY_DN960_c0_g1_i2.p1  ORF type:complete len:400 (-),score=29.58 TRINITY_DN960_c0_g1_i2:173-1372(-)
MDLRTQWPLVRLRKECSAGKAAVLESEQQAKANTKQITDIKEYFKNKQFRKLIEAYEKAKVKEDKVPPKDLIGKNSFKQKIELAALTDFNKFEETIGRALSEALKSVPVIQYGCMLCNKIHLEGKYTGCSICGLPICFKCVYSCGKCQSKVCSKCAKKCEGECRLQLCTKCVKKCGKCLKAKCVACWKEECAICKKVRGECCLQCGACSLPICSSCTKEANKCEKCATNYCKNWLCKCITHWYNREKILVHASRDYWDKYITDKYISGAFEANLVVKQYIPSENSYDVIAGIEKYTGSNKNETGDQSLSRTGTAYGLCFKNYKAFLNYSCSLIPYGTTIKAEDIITITYNKAKELIFAVNGQSYGVAYSDIEGPFYLFCYSTTQIELEIWSVKTFQRDS